MPFGFHLAVDTLPSRELQADGSRSALACFQLSLSCPFKLLHTFHLLRPARHYPRVRIRRSSFEHRRDFNPPEQRAAQRTPYGLLRLPTQRRRALRLRLIARLTATEFPPTTQDLDRSLTLPSVHAVARNTGDDGCFSSLRIHNRCCLRPYTGGSTIPFPNSPSNTRSRCHDGAIHSLSVRPERLPVPPDWVLRLRVGSAAT
jgi:hypothetical protein